MKTISDIRLYKNHTAFGNKMLNAAIHRIVMKLREQHFSLEDFDHLYINFTTCDEEGSIRPSDQVDRYHPWYRNCDVGISTGNMGLGFRTDCPGIGEHLYVGTVRQPSHPYLRGAGDDRR